jgi:hypothetical protein
MAVDPDSGKAAADLISLLAPGGMLISYGMLAPESIPLHPSVLIGGEIGVRGQNPPSWTSPPPIRWIKSPIQSVTYPAPAKSARLSSMPNGQPCPPPGAIASVRQFRPRARQRWWLWRRKTPRTRKTYWSAATAYATLFRIGRALEGELA